MKKLIKMYNEKYGNTLGVIDDDFNKEQMYRIYYFIKNNCDDKEIQERLAKIKLDKPKTLEQQLTKLESEHNKEGSAQVKLIPIPYGVDSYHYVNIYSSDINIKELLEQGGFLHFIVNVGITSLDIPVLFDMNNLLSYETYQKMPVYYASGTQLFEHKMNYDTFDSFKVLNVYSQEIRMAESFDDNHPYIWFNVKIYDSLTPTNANDYNKNITYSISNVYFEPRNIPETQIKPR